MIKYLLRLSIFSIPLLTYFLLVLLVDPFNFVGTNRDDSERDKISYQVDHVLWNCINFKNEPKEIIILGDSRVTGFSNQCVRAEENEFFNMGFNGASLKEIINGFWDITEQVKLKEVYIGFGFHEYNALAQGNRLDKAFLSRSNFFSYCLNKSTFKSIIYYFKSKLFSPQKDIRSKSVKKWDKALKYIDRTYYSEYEYPEEYFKSLKKISEYCKKNKIRLVFFIPPNHLDVRNIVKKNGLELAERKFKEDLSQLGDVLIDFDLKSDMTVDKNDYEDPFHIGSEIFKLEICDKISN